MSKVSYDKLWKILEDRKMMKTELIREAKISSNAMAKLGRNEDDVHPYRVTLSCD